MSDDRRKNSNIESSGTARARNHQSPKEPTGRLLTLREAEQQFGVDEYWIYRWVDEGRVHAVQEGKRFKYPDWELASLTNCYPALVAA